MKGIIIDDDSTIRVLLKEYCLIQKNIEIINDFDNSVEALNFLSKNNVDVVFLDIHMPMLSGIEIVNSLVHPPKIVMVTSDSDFAIDAFKFPFIIDYLLKPLSYSRFLLAIQKLQNEFDKHATNIHSKEERSLFVNSNGRTVKLDFVDIDFVEANSDYVNIYTENKRYIVNSTLKNILSKLPSVDFIQVHRSYIVNVTKIVEIEDNTLVIGKKLIPVSKSNKANLLNKLNVL